MSHELRAMSDNLQPNPRSAQLGNLLFLRCSLIIFTAHRSPLEAEHVAYFHEELAAIVDVRAGSVGHISGASGDGSDHIEIL